MGGSIKVVIRKENYEIVSMNRWTNGLSNLIHNPKCFLDIDGAIDEYISNTREPFCKTHAPIEYGIVVFDLKTKTLISSQGYSSHMPYLMMSGRELKIDSAFGTYDSQEIQEYLEKGYLKSFYTESNGRYSLTGVKNIHELETKLNSINNIQNVSQIRFEIETNGFKTHFWDSNDLPDARLKMKEIGIVFSKEDEKEWSEYFSYYFD